MTTLVDQRSDYQYKTGTNRLGLWLFILSDAFVFGGLLVSRFYLLGSTRPDLNPLLGLIVTSILLLSSFFMNRAETSIRFGDQKGFLNGTMATSCLVPFLDLWSAEANPPYTAGENATASIFYTMTGFHAFHVLTGVLLLIIVYRKGRKGIYTAERHWAVEAGAIYWHFVDVVWVFFYPALYLMGHVAS
jgi:cytochrome c oxidase subunit 3